MNRLIILAFAAMLGCGAFSLAQATETIGTNREITEADRGGRGRGHGPRGGRHRRGGSSFNFGFNLGGPGYYNGYSRRPVMVCDSYGYCWYQYR